MGSGWCLRLVCSPLAELYQRWMTTILSALSMIIKFHWWPISFSKEHTYSNTDLFEEWFDKQSREVCVSTVHLLSRWKFLFVVCALSERWWFWAQCVGWIVLLVFSVWQHHFSRWLPNHVNNLVMWFSVHSDISVVQRSIYKFYLMDQSHEHSYR